MTRAIVGQVLFGALCFTLGWASGRLNFLLSYGGPRVRTEIVLLISACLALGVLVSVVASMYKGNVATQSPSR